MVPEPHPSETRPGEAIGERPYGPASNLTEWARAGRSGPERDVARHRMPLSALCHWGVVR